MNHALTYISLVVAVCVGAASGQPPVEAERVSAERLEKALDSFKKLPPRSQKTILKAVRSAVDAVEDDYLKSVRACIAEGNKLASKSKLKTRQKRDKSEPTAGWRQHVPFPVEQEYAFGYGKTFEVDPIGKRPPASRRQAIARYASLTAMVHGNLPDLDRAVAALLHRMDRVSGSAEFVRLLEIWRNGPESFYHALDRTAGTDQSLFFYNAMLDDFVVRCVPKGHADYRSMRRDLDKAHDALHQSFLAYRQYRAFREAVALSLVLSPATPLPPSLKRYDDASRSQYSTRQQLGMLLLAAKQDIAAVVSDITECTKPLPKTLWDQKYDPFPAFQALVDGKRSEFLKLTSRTDKLADQARDVLLASRRRVADAACAALLASLSSRKH